jgi:hypothetical protein
MSSTSSLTLGIVSRFNRKRGIKMSLQQFHKTYDNIVKKNLNTVTIDQKTYNLIDDYFQLSTVNSLRQMFSTSILETDTDYVLC